MPFSFECTGADKDQLVASLAVLLLSDCEQEVTAEAINAVVSGSGNSVPAYYPTLYANFVEKAGGIEGMCSAPAAGGAVAAAPAASGAAPAAAAPEAPKEEEVDALDGGMDMFGGGGGGDY